MTGVPRLPLLPVPAAPAGAAAVAVPDAGEGRRAKAVMPVTPARPIQARHSQARHSQTQHSQARSERGDGRDRVADGHSRGDTTAGRVASFSRLTSMPFMVQVLGQQAAAGRAQAVAPQTSLAGHRDAALLGSDLYRRAGGEPELLPDGATFVRLAV